MGSRTSTAIMSTGDQPQMPNVGQAISQLARELADAQIYLGHGTASPRDEAAAIVFYAAGLDHQQTENAYERRLDSMQWRQARALVETRIRTRRPLPYLTGEAWFAGLRFIVDERVIVPRSPFAELIRDRFQPWLSGGKVTRILDLCTGSGCMAVACATYFPDARVTASDLSADALSLAAENVAYHQMNDRIELVSSDLIENLQGRFDLIVSNPPNVPEADIRGLPAEYQHEPGMALSGGADGLDSVRRILHDAPPFLTADGLLVLEVGKQAALLEQIFPDLPFIWPELIQGGSGIALINRADLARSNHE